MKIISPSFEVLTPFGPLGQDTGVQLLRFIEKLARISHRSEDKQTEDSWQKFIQAVVLGHGDWSVVEHASLTVVFRVDRGITHELVRHRLFSFTQESTRFCNYEKKGGIDVIKPQGLKEDDEHIWQESVAKGCWTYSNLIQHGSAPQLARSVLPNALAATISMTGNLRNWRHFFIMRTSKETHPDLRAISIPM